VAQSRDFGIGKFPGSRDSGIPGLQSLTVTVTCQVKGGKFSQHMTACVCFSRQQFTCIAITGITVL